MQYNSRASPSAGSLLTTRMQHTWIYHARQQSLYAADVSKAGLSKAWLV